MKLSPLYLLLIGTCFPLAIVDGQSTTDKCTTLAESADCSFYTECVERNMPCGPSGYAVGYGYHLCNAFGELSRDFTPQGQTWMQSVRKCLINAIFIQYENGDNCEQLRESAFSSHPECYVSNGFCSDILFSITNLRGLYNVLSTKISALFTPLSLKQVIDTAARCTSRGTGVIQSFLQSAIEAASNRLYAGFLEDIREGFSVSCTRDFHIMFVLDSSGSIGPSNFEIMTAFVADAILALNPTNGSKIGVILFSSTPQVVIPLATTHNLNNLASQVQAISYTGGNTLTHTALDLMVTQLGAASAEGAAPIGILLTDGQSNDPDSTLEAAARVHAVGISMYTFGISNTNSAELQAIASSPVYDYSFYISSFSAAEFDQLVLLLTRQTCSTPESGLLDEASTHALAQGEKTYITYPFDTEKGVTLQYQVEEGTLNVFGSFSVRNPTQSTADFTFVAESQTTFYVSPEKYNEATGKHGRSARQVQAMPGNTTTPNVTLFTAVSGLDGMNTFTVTTVLGEANGTFGAVRVTFSVVLMAALAYILM